MGLVPEPSDQTSEATGQPSAPPPPASPLISPDGRFWWDGARWVPFPVYAYLRQPGETTFLDVLMGIAAVLGGAWLGGSVTAPFDPTKDGSFSLLIALAAAAAAGGLIAWRVQLDRRNRIAARWWRGWSRVGILVGVIAPSVIVGWGAANVTTGARDWRMGIGGLVGLALGVVVERLIVRRLPGPAKLQTESQNAEAAAAVPPPPAQPAPVANVGWWWTGSYWMPLAQPWMPGAPPVVLSPKSPGLHLLASLFVPGLGTILAEKQRRGFIILGSYIVLWLSFMVLVFSTRFPQCSYVTKNGLMTSVCSAMPQLPVTLIVAMVLAVVVGFPLQIFSIVDGYRSAQAWNRAHGILS